MSEQPAPVRRPSSLYGAYVFDLDGTVYLGDELLPGVSRLVAGLRHLLIPVRFVSNNPTRDPRMYAEKLTGMGLPTSAGEIINTVVTTTHWLRTHHPHAVLYPIAEPPLVQALAQAGFRLSEDPAEIDIVIASYDRTFDYRKLQIAFDAIWFHQRAFLIQTNSDPFCPLPGGRGEPDCAAITAAIEACTGAPCLHSLGKPSPIMIETVLAGLEMPPEQVLLVGDRLQTDFAMAAAAGLGSAVVLTGDATADAVAELPSDHAPDYVVERADQVLPHRLWETLGWAS